MYLFQSKCSINDSVMIISVNNIGSIPDADNIMIMSAKQVILNKIMTMELKSVLLVIRLLLIIVTTTIVLIILRLHIINDVDANYNHAMMF